MGDTVTGMTTVAAILAALLERGRTGEGQLVSTSLLRTGAYCIGMELSTRVALGKLAPPPSRVRPQNPLMKSYADRDGAWFWLIGAEADRHWPGIKAAADDPRLDEEHFATARDRRKEGAELVAILDEAFARRTRAEWAEVFTEHDVWWTPVNTAADLIEDPQAQAAGVFVDVPGPDHDAVRSVATPVAFGDAPLAPGAGPPRIGADTDVLLREIGVDSADVDRLREAGVVAGPPTDEAASEPAGH